MHEFVFFNDQLISADEAAVSAISSIALYGKGIFTTIAIYNSKPFLWEKHWTRLTENSQKLGIDLSNFNEDYVKTSLLEIILRNQVVNGRCRLTFLDEKPSKIWSFPSEMKTSFLITTAGFRESSDINLAVSPFRINSTSPLVNTKSCNYLEPILALEEATKRGFNEAIRLNEKGEIASACLANIFWIENDQIFTPELETGCLAGTMRSFILDSFQVQEVKANLETLQSCEIIFLTSSGIGIKQVNRFNSQAFQSSKKNDEIKAFFEKHIK